MNSKALSQSNCSYQPEEMAQRRIVPSVCMRADFEDYLSGFLEEGKRLALLFDFDGTLAPIVEHPEDAKMPTEIEEALRRLSNNPKVFVAIISGRGLADAKSKAGLANITYAGNHGFEIENADGSRSDYELPEKIKASYRQIIDKLLNKVAKHGAWIEDKRVSLTFHFRKTPAEFVEPLKNEAIAIIRSHGWIANEAHCAVEGKPPIAWNKGEAAKYILTKHFGSEWQNGVKVIFVGDDTTDEDAMKALQGVGKSFRISANPLIETYADFRLPTCNEIRLLLEWIEKTY